MTSLTQHLKQCLAVLRSLRCPCCPRSSEAAPRSSGSAPVPGALLTAARCDKGGSIVSVGGGGGLCGSVCSLRGVVRARQTRLGWP